MIPITNLAQELMQWQAPIDIETRFHAKRIRYFLSRSDALNDHNYVLCVMGNWTNKGKIDLVSEFAHKYRKSPIILSGGIGRMSSEKAHKLGSDAEEMKSYLVEHGVNSDRMVLFPEGRTTGDNADYILRYITDNHIDGQLLFLEYGHLGQRVRATVKGRLFQNDKTSVKTSDVFVVTCGNWEDLIRSHEPYQQAALYALGSEVKRLYEYSALGNIPFNFPRDISFEGVETIGGMTKLDESYFNISKNLNEGEKIIKDSELALKLFRDRKSVV